MSRRLPSLLRPGGPDDARQVIQEPRFRQASALAPPRGRCLDAGSGTIGRYSPFLESFDAVTEIVNVDVNEPKISKHRSDPRHRDVEGSVTDLPFEDASFDWVLCASVLPLVEDDKRAAGELARVLRPGGEALISARTAAAPRGAHYPREGYSLEGMEALLGDAGLDVIWHGYTFYASMKRLGVLWRWQQKRFGRNLMPRAAVLLFGYADRWLPIGRPWNLTVLARRREGA
jgi:ubiquinone/menaquinone biosynthesis C-methylase UbiE